MNSKRYGLLALSLSLGAVGAAASCSSTPAPSSVAAGCSISSDCNGNLICAFGRCHDACMTSKDCTGATCLPASGGDVCELEQETTCTDMLPCVKGLTCADDICRAPCMPGSKAGTTGGCLGGQSCVAGSKKGEFVCVDGNGGGTGDGGSGDDGNGGNSDATMSDAMGGSKGDGGSSKDAGTDTSNSCPSAQTQFGGIAQGDTNSNFVSGLGVRTATELLIFDDYYGPNPAGDAGADAGSINYLYVQSFDPVTGKKKDAARPLTPLNLPGSKSTSTYALEAAVVAPTGEVAILFSDHCACLGASTYLSALFLAPALEAGASPAGLQPMQTVPLELAGLGATTLPQAIWSNASQAFVFSWVSNNDNGPIVVQTFLPNGTNAGGGTGSVPTDQANNTIGPRADGLATSGSLLGVGWTNAANVYPYLTVLDALGNEIGSPILLDTLTSGTGAPAGSGWVAVGGTPAGFVTFYSLVGGVSSSSEIGTNETFISVNADGGVPASQFVDGGDAGLPRFHFSGTAIASYGIAIDDDVEGGAGGVGLALLYPDSVSFAYVDANGSTHVGPDNVIPHTYTGGDYINLNNLGGSFGVSLYSSTNHSTQAAASGCQ